MTTVTTHYSHIYTLKNFLFCCYYIELCCATCLYEGRHKGHKNIKIDDITDAMFGNVTGPFNGVLEKTQELKEKLEEEIDELTNNINEVQDKITEHFNKLRDDLDRQEGKIKKDFENVFTETKEKLGECLTKINEIIKNNKRLIAGKKEAHDSKLKMSACISRMNKEKGNMD